MMSLKEIGKKYPTNKNDYGFLDIYEKYFEPLREKKLNILEIGVDKGDSLRLWKEYFFNSPPDKNVLLTIAPKKIIIVEGLFLFHYVQVNQMLDFSIFVDVDLETQLDRRIYRDQESRGYDESDIIYQWNNHVTPCFKNYIEPFKEQSSFIYRNDKNSEKDFTSLIEALSDKTMTIK